MRNEEKVLVLGASGFIGGHLVRRLRPENVIATYNNTRLEYGVKFDSLTMHVRDILPDPDLVSCAVILLGDTRLDSCAADKTRSRTLNVVSIKNLIRDLNALAIPTVFVSTDSVFDGNQANYSETDIPNPIVTYGKQKVEVEKFLQERGGDYCIVRLSKVYGTSAGDGTLFSAWYDSLGKGEVIRVATDQVFSPIFVDDAVQGLIQIMRRRARGLYHLCGPVSASQADFLDILIARVGSRISKGARIERCSIREFNFREPRPLNLSMRCEEFLRLTGLVPRAPAEAMQTFLEPGFPR